MSKIDGEFVIEVAGHEYRLRYDWKALSEVEAAHGDTPNLWNAEVAASVAAFGFRRNHPDMTAERILELSPPLVPFIKAIQTALQWAYFGPEAVQDDDKKKAHQLKAGLLRRLFRR